MCVRMDLQNNVYDLGEIIMTSVIYIVLYFGKMREDFPLWLKTCSYNPTINWLIITDDKTDYCYPKNVNVLYQSFEETKNKFSKHIDFPIVLDTPYKLCDYKPLYGEVYAEYIGEYDFWGHCDLDILWGDIRKFLTEDIFQRYDKIGFLGHSTLYRNSSEVNMRWRCLNGGGITYREAFQSSENMFFDERAMNEIYEANGWKIYKKQIFADLTDYRYNFFLTNVAQEDKVKNKRQIFSWGKGKLKRYYIMGKNIDCDEFMYIHFLKRKMELYADNTSDKWLIIPNKIINYTKEPSYKIVKKYSKSHWGKYFFNLFLEKRNKITVKNIFSFLVRRGKKYYALKYKNDVLNDNKM